MLSFVMRVKLSPPVQCCRCSWATATRTSLPGAVCSSQQTIGSQERMRQIAGEKSFGTRSRKRKTLNIFVQTLSVGSEQFVNGKRACDNIRITRRRKK